MRRIFVSRSSLENPNPLERLVRTSSPSNISTLSPLAFNSSAKRIDKVVLPAPDKPVNHKTNPLSIHPPRNSLRLLSVLCVCGELEPSLNSPQQTPRTQIMQREEI